MGNTEIDMKNKLFCSFTAHEYLPETIANITSRYPILYSKLFILESPQTTEYLITYNVDTEKPLTEIMRTIAIKEDNGPAISHKEDNSKLIAYFLEVLPDYDQERVYPSDIKKIVNWYNMLQAKGLVSKEEPKIENAEEVLEQVVKDVATEKAAKPAKKIKSK